MSANTERIDRRLITLKTDAAKLPSWKIKTQKAGEKCCINMSKNVPYAVLPPQAEIGQTNISQLQMFDCLVRSILIFQQSTTSWYFFVYSLSNNNFYAIAVQIYIKTPNYKPVGIKNLMSFPRTGQKKRKKCQVRHRFLSYIRALFVTILYIWGLLFNPLKLGLWE